jgi:general stress protein 26
MGTKQGDPALIQDPVAQELLHSTEMARLAYVWDDGTPRVIPIWFHWDGEALVFGTPIKSPKMHIIPNKSAVAVTIDSSTWPYKVLSIRGTAEVTIVNGVVAEYAAAARRYFGDEQGEAWAGNVGQMMSQMARIAVRPTWVAILDFEQRFPSAIEEAMSQGGTA